MYNHEEKEFLQEITNLVVDKIGEKKAIAFFGKATLAIYLKQGEFNDGTIEIDCRVHEDYVVSVIQLDEQEKLEREEYDYIVKGD